jgi:DHA1 family bicyclomycin/chloramphenicol resistance-like MFS transporter
MSTALIPVGMLADAFGRKRVLLTGLAVLIAASIACALAPGIWALLALRFVQGLGASACMVITYAIAADCFQGAKLVGISGLIGAAWGLAPVLAPAAGGLIVQYFSWRVVFAAIAGLALVVTALVSFLLPETLPASRRSRIDLGAALGVFKGAFGNGRFLSFTFIFALMASAQLVFGVVAPFLYQEKLGFSPAAYGAVALALGAANLSGELACGGLASRISAKQLCFGGWAFFAAGAVVLAVTGSMDSITFAAITIGGALALAGCGTLCPTMYGMALGLFSRNLGLIGGLITTVCYLAVSVTMTLAAFLPESSQGPLGWLYVSLAALAFFLLALSFRSSSAPVNSPEHHHA